MTAHQARATGAGRRSGRRSRRARARNHPDAARRARKAAVNGFQARESAQRPSTAAPRLRVNPVVATGSPVKWWRMEGGTRPAESQVPFQAIQNPVAAHAASAKADRTVPFPPPARALGTALGSPGESPAQTMDPVEDFAGVPPGSGLVELRMRSSLRGGILEAA
jgi:hypothetical protein